MLMANAAPELLDIAEERGWRITVSNDQDGVAAAVEEFLAVPATAGAGLEEF